MAYSIKKGIARTKAKNKAVGRGRGGRGGGGRSSGT